MARPVRAFPWARLLLGLWLAATAAWACALASGRASAWWALALLVGVLGTIAFGVFFAQLGLFARPIVAAEQRGAGDRLALTFDDGPDLGPTDEILGLLAARGQQATFFVIGRKAEVASELLAKIVAGGHALGNHSHAHRHDTPFLTPEVLAVDLRKAEGVLDGAVGRARRRWFRPPIGIVSPRVARAAALAGLEMVSWSVSARDGTRRATVEGALARLRPRLTPGAIVVLHDGAERGDRTPIAPALLARLLDELDLRKLRSVTLDELLRDETSRDTDPTRS